MITHTHVHTHAKYSISGNLEFINWLSGFAISLRKNNWINDDVLLTLGLSIVGTRRESKARVD